MGALHNDHAKLINTVTPSMLEIARKILIWWSKRNPCLKPKCIQELLALLDPPSLVAGRVRNPFRSQCTNMTLWCLFYYHAGDILGHTRHGPQHFPHTWNKFLNELWHGCYVAVTIRTPYRYRYNGLRDSHLPFKKRMVVRRCKTSSQKRLDLLACSSSINSNKDHLCVID